MNRVVYEKLRAIILVCNPTIDITDFPLQSHLKNDIGLDSIEIMEVIGAIEDEFDIEISERMIRELQYVDSIIEFINGRCQTSVGME